MNELQQHDIFLSYSRSNDKKALDVFESLGAQGWTVFMDKDIPNAALWDKYLKNQLNTVKCILVLWSKEAVQSKWVRKEASIGKKRRNLVHANLDGCDIPSEFSEMHYNDLSKWNYFNVHYPQYLKVLEYVAKLIGANSSLGTLPTPKTHETITEDHIALTSSSWLHNDPDLDSRFPYKIHLRLVAKEVTLKRIANVVYYFEPEYAKNLPDNVDSNLEAYVRISNYWRNGFSVYELASGYTVVRAKVKVREQAKIVVLSRLVDIMDEGPWLNKLYKKYGTKPRKK